MEKLGEGINFVQIVWHIYVTLLLVSIQRLLTNKFFMRCLNMLLVLEV